MISGMPTRKLLLIGGGLAVAITASLMFGWWQVDGPGAPERKARESKLPLPIAQMDFSLSDHKGNRVQPADWVGQPLLVFFGFTYCPDICPTTLADITGWLEVLGEDTKRINVAFITVDPERDTADAMAAYVENFHPAIVGYTGSPQDIADVAAGFKVKYEKIVTGQTYTMDHTAGVFVYDAEGRFVSIIDFHEPRENAVPKIRRAL
jgi:protein SCO1/2